MRKKSRGLGRPQALGVSKPRFFIIKTKAGEFLVIYRSRGIESRGKLGGWEVGRLGSWEVGKLGGWEVGRLGGWEVGRLGGLKFFVLSPRRV